MPAPRRPSTRAATASLDALWARRRRLAAICEAYPETLAADRYTNEHRSLEVAGKRFGYFLHDHFGDDGRSGVVLKAEQGVQEALVEQDAEALLGAGVRWPPRLDRRPPGSRRARLGRDRGVRA